MRIGYVCEISLEDVEMKNLQYVHSVATMMIMEVRSVQSTMMGRSQHVGRL